MSNILGPDQTRCSVGPELDQNGLMVCPEKDVFSLHLLHIFKRTSV